MSWTIESLPEQRLIRVTTAGVLDLAMLQALGQDALAAGRATGCHKYLIDHRQAATDLGALDIHELPDWYAAIGVGPGLRIATLLAGDAVRREDFEHFHAQAGNRGAHQYRLFDRLDEAMRWLAEAD